MSFNHLINHDIRNNGALAQLVRMKKAHPTVAKDYSGLFLGIILAGLVAIVFVLMVAVGQSRARSAAFHPFFDKTGVGVGAADSALTPTIYFTPRGTN